MNARYERVQFGMGYGCVLYRLQPRADTKWREQRNASSFRNTDTCFETLRDERRN